MLEHDMKPAPRKRGDDRVLQALAQGKTYGEAAKEAGVSRKTVQRRMASPIFRAELDDLRRSVVRQVESSLAQASISAVAALEAQLAHRDPWLAQKAATALLSFSAKAREQELAALEEKVAGALETARERGLLR